MGALLPQDGLGVSFPRGAWAMITALRPLGPFRLLRSRVGPSFRGLWNAGENTGGPPRGGSPVRRGQQRGIVWSRSAPTHGDAQNASETIGFSQPVFG